ncbi:MAG: hypothetical protein RL616_1868 [Verrucomicrobiota bacterium]|jgi:hypothetical protein
MKSHLKHLSAGALVLAALNSVHAQYAPPPPPAPFPGFLNEYMRGKDPYANQWDLGGDFRARFEMKEGFGIAGLAGSVDFRDRGKDVNNEYFLFKTKLHAGYTDKWWSAFAELRSSVALSDERVAYANVPAVADTQRRVGNGPEHDPFDVHQLYFTLGNHKEFPVSLKLGRQELSYGEERLVGAFAWNNIGRVFDAAKIRWQNEWFAAEAFSGWVVIPESQRFNEPNTQDWFSGVDAISMKIPKTILEGYFFARNVTRGAINYDSSPQFPQPTARDIYTIGGRLKNKPGEIGNFDYTIEGAYQFGDYAATATGRLLRQDAFMFVAQGGYTFADLWATPRLGLEYSYGSGDNNSKDGVHGTFENLFPTNHKFYGYMDFASLQNLQDVRTLLTFKPTTRSSIAIEGHGLWLANKNDNFYNVGGGARTTGGYGVNPNYGNFLGTEVDVIGGYAVTRNMQVEAGYGHFFTANYIQQTLAGKNGGSQDADWVYLQTTIKF